MPDLVHGFYKKRPTYWELYQQSPTTLWTNVSLPTGISEYDLKSMILREFGDMETVADDALTLHLYLLSWGDRNVASWQRMVDALAAEYDPLHNYDRTETETENVRSAGSTQTAGSSSQTEQEQRRSAGSTQTAGSDNRTEQENLRSAGSSQFAGTTHQSGTSTDEKQVAGFNSDTYVPSEMNTTTPDLTNDSSSGTQSTGSEDRGNTVSGSTSSSAQTAGTEDRGSTVSGNTSSSAQTAGSEDRGRELRAYGNIGVTTSQEMLEAEIKLRAKYTAYGVILESFRREILVGVW